MKMTAYWFCVFCVTLMLCHSGSAQHNFSSLFHDFIHKYGKEQYLQDKAEYSKRFQIFKDNLVHQNSFNNRSRKHNDSDAYGVNKFSDLTPQEFQAQYLKGFTAGNITTPGKAFPLLGLAGDGQIMAQLPKKVDWRDKKIISGIKNQGSCGGCWAFSTTEAVESMHALKTGHLQSLSAQEVLDCSYGFQGSLFGCQGGDTCTALSWMAQSQVPLLPESVYPTKDKVQACKFPPGTSKGVAVTDFTCHSFVKDESMMLHVLATVGPVAVSIDASTWQSYLGGIIRFHCGQEPNNHAVLVVGYDTTGDVPFYIVKNSWGPDFGDHGYLYVAVGHNVCGIANRVSTVQV